jgi:hypothetical protein
MLPKKRERDGVIGHFRPTSGYHSEEEPALGQDELAEVSESAPVPVAAKAGSEAANPGVVLWTLCLRSINLDRGSTASRALAVGAARACVFPIAILRVAAVTGAVPFAFGMK